VQVAIENYKCIVCNFAPTQNNCGKRDQLAANQSALFVVFIKCAP